MAAEVHSTDLIKVVMLLGAAVVMVPLFRRLGLGSILGYLVAGLLIGPFGLKWFTEPQSILHVAELGVVMFLFIIGLEMRPSHLWGMRKDIFGLGSLQILICTALLTFLGMAFGYGFSISLICGMGFVLTSTAIVMQLLDERGILALPRGQKIVAILLFEDLLIVPLLALVAIMAPSTTEISWTTKAVGILTAIGSLSALVIAGIWLLNPLFRLLALSRAREVMAAAALLVVLGSALLMQESGLSMALGAFLAGVLLSESSFRHQIEADIEPFRGVLLGLFFMGVGMSLDFGVVTQNWISVVVGVILMMAAKGICIYITARTTQASHREAMERTTLMAQGGEFAFVLFAAATTTQVITQEINALMTAIVILSMALTPLVVTIYRRLESKEVTSYDGIDKAEDLTGRVLIIGFGRFGQILSQLLLARNTDVTIIDSDVDMIKSASTFGFKVYYGDGARLDVLRASGAGTAHAIAICIDKQEATNHIVELVRSEFPQAKLIARSYDRNHSASLIKAGVDYQIRETFESAMLMGAATLKELGVGPEEVAEISSYIRKLDRERMEISVAHGLKAGRHLILGNIAKPTPFVAPKRLSQPLSVATEEAVMTPAEDPQQKS